MDPKALLDELMGKDRNVPLELRSEKRIAYDDAGVCKFELAALCPHRLFKNTKSDLGLCEYETHSDHIDWPEIKEQYERQADDKDKERYERRLMRCLADLVRVLDIKIQRAKERADKESAPKALRPEDQARLGELQATAKEIMARSQAAGEAGDVDAAIAMAAQAESLTKQHADLLRRVSAPERTMAVCDVCGIFMNSTDNEERRQEHYAGKQYIGWKAIREEHDRLVAKFAGGGGGGGGGGVAPFGERAFGERVRERVRERSRSPAAAPAAAAGGDSGGGGRRSGGVDERRGGGGGDGSRDERERYRSSDRNRNSRDGYDQKGDRRYDSRDDRGGGGGYGDGGRDRDRRRY